jgi:hypothetical protein
MRRHLSSVPFVLVLPLTTVLVLAAFIPPAAAITFGQVDTNNTYPNVGCLVYQPPDAPGPIVVCTGMLVHPRVFLTAGHATIQAEQDPALIPRAYVSFAANAFDKSDRSTWSELEGVITHPNYGPVHNQVCNDVGAIILKKPLRGVPLANLPYAGYLDDLKAAGLLRLPGEGGVPLILVGYGGTGEWPPPATAPGDGWRRFVNSDYLGLEPGWLLTQQNPATENGGFWIGDSGGPSFRVEPDGTLRVVALAGNKGALISPGWSWRVDIPATLDFTSAVVAGLE